MNSFPIDNRSKYIIYLSLFILIFLSLSWNLYTQKVKNTEIIKNTARTSLDKDKIFRFWAASHGGVYVKIDENTRPNPYLSHLPDRDIQIGDKNLTLMNPAYMIRQIMDRYTGLYGQKGHITSLKPLNPDNAPDEWEIEALHAFENGSTEISSFVKQEGEEYLRMMVPLHTKKECLKCHGKQGYKDGDLRGGLSVSIPLSRHNEIAMTTYIPTITTHLFFLLLALLVTHLTFNKIEENTLQLIDSRELLMRQAKYAQMGEMLSMITHQWRQPLNALSASSIQLSMKQKLEMLEADDIAQHTKFVEEQTQKMSHIINDFMTFFKPEKMKQEFTVDEIKDDIDTLMSGQLSSRGIELLYRYDTPIVFYNYRKVFAHVLVNLIANSRDAYEGMDISPKEVIITFSQDATSSYVTIEDSAGGIPEEVMDKIFDPYFTTKEEGKGTGIGLSMTQRFVEELLDGTIEASNTASGVLFTIKFPSEQSSENR